MPYRLVQKPFNDNYSNRYPRKIRVCNAIDPSTTPLHGTQLVQRFKEEPKFSLCWRDGQLQKESGGSSKLRVVEQRDSEPMIHIFYDYEPLFIAITFYPFFSVPAHTTDVSPHTWTPVMARPRSLLEYKPSLRRSSYILHIVAETGVRKSVRLDYHT
ncbi:hypothetical protein BDZ94DRAFT_1062485 [Collybia nuda]|uniref:Uncharacterized protein n=1 Tax=Collybia nuda TaxID=64659 RepID=A0A9P5XYH9_9AGAR|nr:hypothetical protein BDZ94DRAFT_1062485 [Collybia nuda]